MKKLMIVLLAMGLVLPAYAQFVVGKVDIQKILVTVKEGATVRDKLKSTFDKKQGILKKEEKKIRKMQDDYQKQSLVMNDKAKAKKEREIQEKIMELQKKSMDYQKEIQEMEQKLKTPILDKVKGIVETVSKKANVDMTFEVSTAPIVYAKNQKDLTDEVIKLYNKKYPVKKKKK